MDTNSDILKDQNTKIGIHREDIGKVQGKMGKIALKRQAFGLSKLSPNYHISSSHTNCQYYKLFIKIENCLI